MGLDRDRCARELGDPRLRTLVCGVIGTPVAVESLHVGEQEGECAGCEERQRDDPASRAANLVTLGPGEALRASPPMSARFVRSLGPMLPVRLAVMGLLTGG